MKKLILPSAITTLLFYCFFAFALWEGNPAVWGEDARWGFVFALGFALFVVCGITITNEESK